MKREALSDFLKHCAVCVLLPGVNKESSAAFLREIAASNAQALHAVIAAQAGFHLSEGDPRVPENVRLLPLPPVL